MEETAEYEPWLAETANLEPWDGAAPPFNARPVAGNIEVDGVADSQLLLFPDQSEQEEESVATKEQS